MFLRVLLLVSGATRRASQKTQPQHLFETQILKTFIWGEYFTLLVICLEGSG